MRNRIQTGLKILIIGSAFIIAGTLTAAEKQPVPDEIIIENDGYKSDKKGPVPFSHLDHAEDYELACTDCHHVYKDGTNVWKQGDKTQACKECHSPLKKQGDIKKLKNAFHRNCKKCHRKLAKEGIAEDAPYKKCGDCHEKRSK